MKLPRSIKNMKLWGWKDDPYTGNFPLSRVIWNLLWIIPVYITCALFVITVFCKGGVSDAKEAWYKTLG